MSVCNPKRWPNSRMTTIERTATTADWATASPTASRNSIRLRARSPTASERAINVMIALSRPRMPILLRTSVADQATENRPSTAGPSNRATRKVKMPRKFEASSAIVLRIAPRFSSTPVSSTRRGRRAADGATLQRALNAWSLVLACLVKSSGAQEEPFSLKVVKGENARRKSMADHGRDK